MARKKVLSTRVREETYSKFSKICEKMKTTKAKRLRRIIIKNIEEEKENEKKQP